METKPKVIVIDETKQSFLGETFYLCGSYYQHKGKRLHRAVWEYHNGKIPKGYHIHHVDGNRSNNDIDNLACLSARHHQTKHAETEERLAYGKMHIERIRPKAVEWHKSEEGIKWHSQQGLSNWKKRTINTYVCTECGKEFQTKYVYGKGMNHFCGQNCRARFGRRNRKK